MSNGVPCRSRLDRTFFRLSLNLLLIILSYPCCNLSAFAASGATPELAEPSQTATVSEAVNWIQPQQVSNGYLLSFPLYNADRDKLTFTSLTSGESRTVAFSFKGALFTVTGAAVVGPNRLAVSGAVVDKTKLNIQRLLLYTTFSGEVLSSVSLGEFAPIGLCAQSDGSAWVLGEDMSREYSIWSAPELGSVEHVISPADDYALLRHFSSDGKLLNSTMKRSTLKIKTDLILDLGSSGSATLTCGAASVGVYVQFNLSISQTRSTQASWHEIDTTTGEEKVWTVAGTVPATRVSGVTLAYENEPYGSFRTVNGGKILSGIYQLKLGSNSVAEWNVVQVRAEAPDSSVPMLKLLGAEGHSLIYIASSATVASTVSSTLAWSTVSAQEAPATPIEASAGVVAQTTTVTIAEAGNVQHLVDWADGFARYILQIEAVSYSKECYSTACLAAFNNMRTVTETWINTAKAKRTVALAVSTKEALSADFTNLNAALKAEAVPTPPTGGGGGGGCTVHSPDGSKDSSSPSPDCLWSEDFVQTGSGIESSYSVHNAIYSPDSGIYDLSYADRPLREAEFLRVSITCQQQCDVLWNLGVKTIACPLIAVGVGILTKNAFIAAVAGIGCAIGAWVGYNSCVDSCGPTLASSCSGSGDYYDTQFRLLKPKRRARPLTVTARLNGAAASDRQIPLHARPNGRTDWTDRSVT